MFSKPEYGWTNITLGTFKGAGSYFTDIPMDSLDACIYSLEHNSPISIFIEEETSKLFITSFYEKTYIIIDDGESTMVTCDITYRELAQMIADDIESYFSDWVNWFLDETVTPERLPLLKSKLSQLKSLLS